MASRSAEKDPEGAREARAQMGALESFLDSHPAIANQLAANPSLINDKSFLKDNPDVVTFLKDHPDLREDWKSKPQAFMKHEQRLDGREPDMPGSSG